MKIIFWKIFLAEFFLKIFLNTFLFLGEKIFDKNISGENIFVPKIFLLKIFLVENIFAKNIFAKNIFSLTPLTVHHLYIIPIPSYPLFEVEGGGDKQTNSRTGCTHVLSLLLY